MSKTNRVGLALFLCIIVLSLLTIRTVWEMVAVVAFLVLASTMFLWGDGK